VEICSKPQRNFQQLSSCQGHRKFPLQKKQDITARTTASYWQQCQDVIGLQPQTYKQICCCIAAIVLCWWLQEIFGEIKQQ